MIVCIDIVCTANVNQKKKINKLFLIFFDFFVK